MLCRRSDGGALVPHPPESRGRPRWLIDRSVSGTHYGNGTADYPAGLKRKITVTDEIWLGTSADSRRQELRAFDSR